MDRKSSPSKPPSRQAIRRAVASSTAIETGKPVTQLEASLRAGPDTAKSPRLRALALAK